MSDFFDRPVRMGGPGGEFRFFPPRKTDVNSEGRDPHAVVKGDPLGKQFPSETHVALLLFLVSLGLYLATLSWTPFPGLPTQALLAHLGGDSPPTPRDPLWGLLVKALARYSGLSLAAWTGLFSAVCGAACVAMLGMLMTRVAYVIRNEPGQSSFIREAQARRLSGLVAGLYLACSIPFWMISTRSLPGSFHLLLLLLAAWRFSEYQHWGRVRDLFFLGLLLGAGAAEHATVLLFLPLALFLIVREIFRWQSLGNWRVHVAGWLGFGLGLFLYPVHATLLFRRGLAWGLFTSKAQALAQILQDQLFLIAQLRFHPGFPVVMFFSVVPWMTLFTMSRRSPWFYEGWQIAVRLIFLGGLMGVLFDASYSPWNLMGTGYLLVTPYLILAICVGYMAGEIWILGEPQLLVDRRWYMRAARRAASALALLIPVAILLAGALNWFVVDARPGAGVAAAADEVLERLDGRDILMSNGLLDDTLQLAVRTRSLPVRVLSAPRTSSPPYLKHLALRFAEDSLRTPLEQADFGQFVENLMLSDTGPSQTAIIDMPDVFREYGYLVPDRFLYRIETSSNRVDVTALMESQIPFWERMADLTAHPAPERNLARPYQDLLGLMVSKVANNVGVMQAERGNEEAALAAFRLARRIHPKNLSVLMNLLEMGRRRELPETEELEADWDRRQEKLDGTRWALAIRQGYLWQAREWVRRGFVWALSGVPVSQEGARFLPPPTEGGSWEAEQLLDQAYLLFGVPTPDEPTCRAELIRDDRNTTALMALCRLALRQNDPDIAEAYIAEAKAMGLPEEEALFDRAMLTHVRGDTPKAVEMLESLSRQTSGDPRVWMALVLLTDENNPLNAQSLKVLKDLPSADLATRISLAAVYLSKKRWKEAQAELERGVQEDPKNTQLWEMMMTLAQESGNRKLMEASLRALLRRDPEHYLQYQNEGIEQYNKGQLAAAESAFRKGIQRRRDPTLLNNLATVIHEQDGNLAEALELVNEALRRQPGNGVMLTTRGEILLKMNRLKEAQTDLKDSLRQRGFEPKLAFLLAKSYELEGDRFRTLAVLKLLDAHRDQLCGEQQRELDALLKKQP